MIWEQGKQNSVAYEFAAYPLIYNSVILVVFIWNDGWPKGPNYVKIMYMCAIIGVIFLAKSLLFYYHKEMF